LTEIMGLPDSHPEAAELVLAGQDSLGRWRLDDTFNGRTLVNIERKGKPSKWVTLNAVRALRAYFRPGKAPSA
jgi:hypothetical protein